MGDKREQQDGSNRRDEATPEEELNPSSGAGYGNNAEEDGARSEE